MPMSFDTELKTAPKKKMVSVAVGYNMISAVQ